MIVLLCISALLLITGLCSFATYVLYAENRQLHQALLLAQNPYAESVLTTVQGRTVKETSELRDRAEIEHDIFDGTL